MGTIMNRDIRGTTEYFVAFSETPSTTERTIYMHHNSNGICVYGLGHINKNCTRVFLNSL